MNRCAICQAVITAEEPPVLTVSGYGMPRCLCEDCARRFDTVTLGREPERIFAAMERIASDLAASGTEDEIVCEAVCEILTSAKERAGKIADGRYDFSEDAAAEAGEELPEELLETEEDKALDRAEKEKNERFDRFLNWAWLGIGICAVAFLVYWFIIR